MRLFKRLYLHAAHVAAFVSGSILLGIGAVSMLQAAEAEQQSQPAPRDAQGQILISREPGERSGLWVPDYSERRPSFAVADIAFKPWAQGLFDARQAHDLEPHARCRASGAIRQLLTPHGVEILELPELQRLYIFDIGGPHSYREVHMDGRSHPTTYDQPPEGQMSLVWRGDEELFEYMCQQANYAAALMVNDKGQAVGATSPIVP